MPGEDCDDCTYDVGGTCTKGNYTYYQGIVQNRQCPYYKMKSGL